MPRPQVVRIVASRTKLLGRAAFWWVTPQLWKGRASADRNPRSIQNCGGGPIREVWNYFGGQELDVRIASAGVRSSKAMSQKNSSCPMLQFLNVSFCFVWRAGRSSRCFFQGLYARRTSCFVGGFGYDDVTSHSQQRQFRCRFSEFLPFISITISNRPRNSCRPKTKMLASFTTAQTVVSGLMTPYQSGGCGRWTGFITTGTLMNSWNSPLWFKTDRVDTNGVLRVPCPR